MIVLAVCGLLFHVYYDYCIRKAIREACKNAVTPYQV